MYMRDGEIVREYRLAKNKKMQVEILADLNACKKDIIIGILKTAGVYHE